MNEETKTSDPVEKDVISEWIGEFGRWQLLMTLWLSLVNIPCMAHLYVINFIAADANATCARPINSQLTQDEWLRLSVLNGKDRTCSIKDLDYTLSFQNLSNQQTNRSVPCTRWTYDTTYLGNTLVTEWDLICDRRYLLDVGEMMFLLGVVFGSLVCGYISDRFGRKKILMTCLLVMTLLGASIAFTPWFSLYLVLRTLLGFFSSSVIGSGLVLCLELVGGKWLNICGVSFMLTVPLSYIILSGLAYITKNWRTLQLVISFLSLLLLPLYWILPESPRWLLTTCKKERVKDVLQHAVKYNNKSLPDNIEELIQQSMDKTGEEAPKVRLMDLFRTSRMRRITLLVYVLWFCVCLLYYGLVLNLSTVVGGDIYIASLISGAVELPAVALSIILLLYFGRRWPVAMCTAGGGIACLLSTLFNKDEVIHLVLLMVGRFFISSPNVTILIYTAELYPTLIRNLGLGSANVAAGIAIMAIPYIWSIAGRDESLPIVVIGLGGVFGGLATLLLPETAGLTEHVEKS